MIVEPAALADLPVHPRGARIVDLHAVDAEVARARLRVLGEDEPERDEAPAVAGPELKVRERGEVRARRHLLRGAAAHPLGPHREHAGSAPAQAPQVAERARREGVQHLLQLRAHRGRRAPERQLDPTPRSEHVDREREFRAAHVLEQQRRAIGAHLAARDLADLARPVHLASHALEIAAALQLRDEVRESAHALHREPRPARPGRGDHLRGRSGAHLAGRAVRDP